MDPIMIELGPLAIRWYGVLIALFSLAGLQWTVREARSRGMDPDAIMDLTPWMVLFGLVGARLVFVLTSPQLFFGPGGRPLDAFAVWQGGISIHGGILGVMLAVFLFAPRKRLQPWAVLDVMTPVAALGIIGGRIGNIMNGTDTGGRPTDWAIGFNWPAPGTDTFGAFGRVVFDDRLWQFAPPACQGVAGDCVVHFTPVYGALVGVLLVPILAWVFRKSTTPGVAFAMFALAYSLLRSVIEEPFRDNPLFLPVYENMAAGVGLFTLTQLVSIPIVLLAAVALVRLDWKRGMDDTVPARRTQR